MASQKLTDREKKINEIRRLNGMSSIKGSEYAAMDDSDKINKKILNEAFGIEYYDENIILQNGQTTHDIQLLERRYANVERFFGISFEDNKTLLHEISCVDYEIGKTIYAYEIKSNKSDLEEFNEDVLKQIENIEKIPYIKNVYAPKSDLSNVDPYFYEGCYIDIQQKYEDWGNYCIFVDNIKNFIKTFIPDFNKIDGNKKSEWIEKLSENTITENIAKYIQDYHLNEHKKAKIDMLASLELPNLTDPKIIEKFVTLYIKQKSSN